MSDELSNKLAMTYAYLATARGAIGEAKATITDHVQIQHLKPRLDNVTKELRSIFSEFNAFVIEANEKDRARQRTNQANKTHSQNQKP